MPELPDITVYRERMEAKLVGKTLEAVRLGSPFVVRSFQPPLREAHGRTITGMHTIGKRLVIELDGWFVVIHLMIAGRLRWRKKGASQRGRDVLAVFDVADGALVLTEASKKKRASIHLVDSREELVSFDRGGIDVFATDQAAFAHALRVERHTLKRSLTDPRLFSGIGNAYSDEILFEVGMAPTKMSDRLTDDEVADLRNATMEVLTRFTERMREEVGDGFPDKVTAFRPDMNVHGRYREPCRRCESPIQRIVHGEHETNYCVTCQTKGKLLADRALSRLLKKDWPKTLEEMEKRRNS